MCTNTPSLAAGSGFIGLSQGFKVLSTRHVCNVVWVFIAALCTAVVSSVPTLGKLTPLTWIGFASIFTAVFTVVVGVTQSSRPAAAPKDESFEILVTVVGRPGFISGLVASINLFGAFSDYSHLYPLQLWSNISMKPCSWIWVHANLHSGHCRDERPSVIYQVSLLVTGTSCFLLYRIWRRHLHASPKSLTQLDVVASLWAQLTWPRYCGQYVASPSLASAGGTIEKVAFSIAIPGFIMTSTLWVHLAAKFVSA